MDDSTTYGQWLEAAQKLDEYEGALQGYLAHKKQPPPLGSPQGPGLSPTVGS